MDNNKAGLLVQEQGVLTTTRGVEGNKAIDMCSTACHTAVQCTLYIHVYMCIPKFLGISVAPITFK